MCFWALQSSRGCCLGPRCGGPRGGAFIREWAIDGGGGGRLNGGSYLPPLPRGCADLKRNLLAHLQLHLRPPTVPMRRIPPTDGRGITHIFREGHCRGLRPNFRTGVLPNRNHFNPRSDVIDFQVMTFVAQIVFQEKAINNK